MTTTPTQYTTDGVEIIAVQQGLSRHPHPSQGGALVPFRWLEELLLADGTSRLRCGKPVNGVDGPICGRDDFPGDAAASAVAHMNSHGRESRPLYPDETLRAVVRAVKLQERDHGDRGKCVRAAEDLNRAGVPTLDGEAWTNTQVSHLYADHKDRFRVRLPAPRPTASPTSPATPTQTETKPVTSTSTSATPAASRSASPDRADLATLSARSLDLVNRSSALFDDTRKLAADLADFIDDTGKLLTELATRPAADPEILEKARNWDQIKGMLAR